MVNEIALKYFAWVRWYTEHYGWTCIPVRDKQPLVKWGQYREERPDPKLVADWWIRQFPCAGIALLTGAPSMNVVILDVDPRNGSEGLEYVDQVTKWGDRVCSSNTPSGGKHFFFRADRPVRTMNNFYPGLDIKGDNGYALLPPSVNKKGQYKWVSNFRDLRIPALPEEVYAEITEKENRNAATTNQESETSAIFELGVDEGGRNNALSKLAGRYFAKGLTRAEVTWLLHGANRTFRPPLDKGELYAVLNSMELKHSKRLAWANSIEG